ncbi:unnamed protein product [Rhizophagus irregularis]|nr:unnamed protein product [Rhizophagus irregularis]
MKQLRYHVKISYICDLYYRFYVRQKDEIVSAITPGTGLWAKGNAGRNYKSTTETMSHFGNMGFRLSAYWTMKWLGHVSYWIIVKSRSLEADSLHGSWNNSSQFLDDSRQFLRFLDDSWTIRNFWMILERGLLNRKRRRDGILEVVCWN